MHDSLSSYRANFSKEETESFFKNANFYEPRVVHLLNSLSLTVHTLSSPSHYRVDHTE